MNNPRSPKVGDTVRYHTIYGLPGHDFFGPYDAQVNEIDERFDRATTTMRLLIKFPDDRFYDVGFVAHKDKAFRDGRWWEYPPDWPQAEPEPEPA